MALIKKILPLFLKNSKLPVQFSAAFVHGEIIPKEVQMLRKRDDFIVMENPFAEEKPQCILCKHKIKVDYKNARLLSQFVSRFTGRQYGRHITGLCTNQHYAVRAEIRKAVTAGFMGNCAKNIQFVNDPELYNPQKPFRPHKYI